MVVPLQLINGGIFVQKCTHVIQNDLSSYWMYFDKWGDKIK